MPIDPQASDPRYTSLQHANADLVVPADAVWRETDTGLRKRGDGVQSYTQLPYEGSGSLVPRMLDPDDNGIGAADQIGTRVIVLGDSTDAPGSTGWWFPYYIHQSKKASIVRSAGVGGDRTDMMLARIQADVLDYRPDIVILGSNTNDLGNAAIVPLAQSKLNIQTMVGMIRAAGALPILRTTLPTDGAGNHPPFDTIATRRQGVLAYNTWLRAYAARNGLDVLDLYQAATDPATGGYKAGYTGDAIHPTETAAKAIADYLLTLQLPAALKGGFSFARAATDESNMIGNAVFVGDSNADGLADLMVATGSGGTYTLTAASSGVTGNWQRVTATSSAVGFRSSTITPTTGTPTRTVWSVGDRISVVGRYRSSGTAAALVRVLFTGATTADLVASATQAVSDGVFSGEFTIPVGTTGIQFLTQATGAGWVEVAEVGMRNLTQLAA